MAPLDQSRVSELDALDTVLRRSAVKKGRSHPKVLAPAKRTMVRGTPDAPECNFRRLRLKRKTRPTEVLQRQQQYQEQLEQQQPKRRRLSL